VKHSPSWVAVPALGKPVLSAQRKIGLITLRLCLLVALVLVVVKVIPRANGSCSRGANRQACVKTTSTQQLARLMAAILKFALFELTLGAG
jgi:hypothetical protein